MSTVEGGRGARAWRSDGQYRADVRLLLLVRLQDAGLVFWCRDLLICEERRDHFPIFLGVF